MSNQQVLRKRLQSTQNIQNIAEAIEKIASVKFHKLLSKMEHLRFYVSKLSEMILNLESRADHPFFGVRPAVNRIAVIVVTGDKGLSGSYNTTVLKQTNEFLSKYRPKQVELILVGQKAIDHFKKRKQWTIRSSLNHVSAQLNESTIKAVAEDYTKSFLNHEFDELWIVYTQFHSVLTKSVKIERILPLHKMESTSTETGGSYIFEPSSELIYQQIIPYFFYTKILSMLFESQASELASRMVSMQAATKNAEEMIKKLTLIKNKVRQQSITREILEINAGAEVAR
ncbi:MAG: ATP synthase F1 subunit gamma [Parachlamydiaceae bacterium]|nr:ATP synthase F1 subunit gamma [Parachlamydiaceae bacterium]